MDSATKVIGLVARWVLAALATWYFFWFITLISVQSSKSQELAGEALAKAAICGLIAGIWFYSANKHKSMDNLTDMKALTIVQPTRNESDNDKSQENSFTFPTHKEKSEPENTIPHNPISSNVQASIATKQETSHESLDLKRTMCSSCGKELADEFSFCPHCGNQKVTFIVCAACTKESSADYKFCPYCGKPFVTALSSTLSPVPVPEDNVVDEQQSELQVPDESIKTSRIGTYVFVSLAIFSLVVSIIKGVVPIYLFESAIWAGAAWYWHKKKTHSELAKGIVPALVVLLVIGEIVQIAREYDSANTISTNNVPDGFVLNTSPSGSPNTPYSSNTPTINNAQTSVSTGSTHGAGVAEIEQQAVTFYKQKLYTEARPLFDEACSAGEMKACNYLGYLYAQGLGGARETKKARDVYQRACDQGTLSSCASLGSLYQDAGNKGDARKYFKKACDGGVSEGCDLLHELK